MQPDEIARLCERHRMPAVAVTDTNNLFGLYDLTEALTKVGVQPIVGCQLELHLDGDGTTVRKPAQVTTAQSRCSCSRRRATRT
jgi:DNA polymerase-3 subunit alpha